MGKSVKSKSKSKSKNKNKNREKDNKSRKVKQEGAGMFRTLNTIRYRNYIRALEKLLDKNNISYEEEKKNVLHLGFSM